MLSRSDFLPYQDSGVDFIKNNPRCSIWADMGLGKTSMGLTAFDELRKEFEVRRALVVAPLRVARRVWSDEIKRWDHLAGITTAKILGTPEQRIAALRTPADVHLINRENIPWLEAQFIQNKKQTTRWPWDMVFLDESQSFKTQGTERHKSMYKLTRLAHRVIELTGTPAPNGYQDLWGQIRLLDRGARLGQYESEYQARWFTCIQNDGCSKWIIRDHAAAEIHERLKDIVFSLKAEDYLTLPEIKYNYIRVKLAPAVMAQYQKLKRTLLAEIGERKLSAANAGVVANKLLQFANGAVYYEGKDWVETHREKLDALEEVLDGLPAPVMVAYGYQHDSARIASVLGRVRWSVLSSDDSFDRFRRGDELDVGILHPASCGHGLNDLHLSGSENIVWFGLTNNLEFYQQLNARLTGGHRAVGKNIVIHHIIADDTADEDMIELLKKKDTDQNDLTRALVRSLQTN